jgi:hypothetical protein
MNNKNLRKKAKKEQPVEVEGICYKGCRYHCDK